MDSCGILSLKTPKEKRERQPNWTEAEKQLLLSLTRMHQVILENKGSDTAAIKRKSDAWDEIAANMKAAGYDRTKERLKQQLGRLRAVEAKKAKDALAKGLAAGISINEATIATTGAITTPSGDNSLPYPSSLSSSALIDFAAKTPADKEMKMSNYEMPVPLPEVIQIKIEKATTLEEFEEPPLQLPLTLALMSQLQGKPNCSTEERVEEEEEPPQQRFVKTPSAFESAHRALFQAVSPLPNGNAGQDDDDDDEVVGETQSTSSAAFKCHHLRRLRCVPMAQSKRKLRMRIGGHSVPRSRTQRIRQLYLYRIAVERQRLKSLRLQQRRDRVLYRKDMQIQNLKLQILRNLANQNRSNHINL